LSTVSTKACVYKHGIIENLAAIKHNKHKEAQSISIHFIYSLSSSTKRDIFKILKLAEMKLILALYLKMEHNQK
jgi:hypothetical protein